MQIPDILKNKTVQLISATTTALVVGSVGGYILGKKNGKVTIVQPVPLQMSMFKKLGTIETLEKTEDGLVMTGTITDEDTAAKIRAGQVMSGHVENVDVDGLHAVDQFVESNVLDPREAPAPKRDYTKPLVEEASQRQLEQFAEESDLSHLKLVNVFTIDDGQWNMEDELQARRPDVPYVIHVDEFTADEMDFRQETLTYYAGDDIMADSADTPIYDYTGLMGPLKFGHGSGDKNIVYIRNEKIHMEWEILRESGSFEHEVLGLALEQEAEQQDLKHAMNLKMRRD